MASLINPIAGGRVTSFFGDPRDGGRRSHEGVDIPAPEGSPIMAAASGRVIRAGNLSATAGLGVVIDHGDGTQTKYFHLSRINVSVNQYVTQGQVIGLVGRTGNAANTIAHLHYEVWQGGRAVDPAGLLNNAGSGAVVSSGAKWFLIAAIVLIFIKRV